MFTWLIQWLLTLVDFKVTVSLYSDNIYLLVKYKDATVFEHTFDVMNNGVKSETGTTTVSLNGKSHV